jgi:hypothetical protein
LVDAGTGYHIVFEKYEKYAKVSCLPENTACAVTGQPK